MSSQLFGLALTVLAILTVHTTQGQNADLCSDCTFVDGVGFNSYPGDCNRYVVCKFSFETSALEVTEMRCSKDDCFDLSVIACKPCQSFDCPDDACRNRGNEVIPYATENCRTFIQCVNGRQNMECCPGGTMFLQGQGCVATGATVECVDTVCHPRGVFPGTCFLAPVSGNNQQFISTSNGVENVMDCPVGTAFNLTNCGCTTLVPIIQTLVGANCIPDIFLPFDVDFSDLANGNYIGNDGVQIENGAARFNGDSKLSIMRYANGWYGSQLTIQFRYREDTQGAIQALLTQTEANGASALRIVSGPSTVEFGLDTGTFQSFTVPKGPLAFDGWRTVEMVYDGSQLRGTVDGVTNSRAMTGSIQPKACALHLGFGQGQQSFVGLIDEFFLYRCL